MTEHVDHLLAAYVAGQISGRQAAWIAGHVRHCGRCRERLARHERLAADLRLALGQNSVPRRSQVEHWWTQIVARPTPHLRPPLVTALIPAIASLVLMLLPLAAGSGWLPTIQPAHTILVPDAALTDIPLASQMALVSQAPPERLGTELSHEATPSPANTPQPVTSIPLIPTAP